MHLKCPGRVTHSVGVEKWKVNVSYFSVISTSMSGDRKKMSHSARGVEEQIIPGSDRGDLF